MNRTKKIKFLQDLQKGIISFKDLKAKNLTRLVGYGPGPDGDRGSIYLINDAQVVESEFNRAASLHPGHTIELGYGHEEN
jgi:hypothetical protein